MEMIREHRLRYLPYNFAFRPLFITGTLAFPSILMPSSLLERNLISGLVDEFGGAEYERQSQNLVCSSQKYLLPVE